MNDMQIQVTEAAEVTVDPRENAVILRKMAMELEVMGRNITSLKLLVHQKLLDETPRGILTIICSETAKVTGISIATMRGEKRKQGSVHARHMAMWLATELTEYSLPRIGSYFHRDHTTVMYARDRVNEMCARDADVRSMLQVLRSQLEVLLGADVEPLS